MSVPTDTVIFDSLSCDAPPDLKRRALLLFSYPFMEGRSIDHCSFIVAIADAMISLSIILGYAIGFIIVIPIHSVYCRSCFSRIMHQLITCMLHIPKRLSPHDEQHMTALDLHKQRQYKAQMEKNKQQEKAQSVQTRK